jgi:hypothetical protein
MSTTTKTGDTYYKFINLKRISDKLKIHPDKLYNNFKSLYNSLDAKDCVNIARLMIPQVTRFFDRIGYDVTFKKRD